MSENPILTKDENIKFELAQTFTADVLEDIILALNKPMEAIYGGYYTHELYEIETAYDEDNNEYTAIIDGAGCIVVVFEANDDLFTCVKVIAIHSTDGKYHETHTDKRFSKNQTIRL